MLVKSKIAVLLASAAAGGTIAAVRNLGAAGLDVRVLSSGACSAAAWSRYVSRSYSISSETDEQRFLQQLLSIGKSEPGQVLLSTSDHTAWLYAENQAQLAPYFLLYQPSMQTMRRILDKKLLAEAATAAGMSVLQSWYPQNIDELTALAPTLPYPILIKPRTQVHRSRNDKGVVVHSENELQQRYKAFVEEDAVRSKRLVAEKNIILQRFVGNSNQAVHSITGFIDRTAELFVTRHAVKVLQRSQPVGVGICFESLPANPSLSDDVRRLCRELNYFGIFEVELLWFDGCWNIIDFNPRMFSQLGLDIYRGSSAPLFAYLDAIGDATALQKAVYEANATENDEKVVFYDRFTLGALVLTQTLTSRISRQDRSYWKTWKRRNSRAVDFAADSRDRKPGIVHVISEMYLGLRAMPRFLRSTKRVQELPTQAAAKMHN
ncbi:D-aspartate ligase [Bradyrhizobium sp. F1.4.3]|uniref:ATP-grasp domain-containing protein n=1 Tax=Bradyrhizobium sp. F1.4.3 TaxID=3156356 RepID=UPI003392BA56